MKIYRFRKIIAVMALLLPFFIFGTCKTPVKRGGGSKIIQKQQKKENRKKAAEFKRINRNL